jgi:hypothetical protein
MFTMHQLPPVYLRARSICRIASLYVYRAPRGDSQPPLTKVPAHRGWLRCLKHELFKTRDF